MKKIILSLIFSSFLILPAYSLGLNVGVSGTAAVFHASGSEEEGTGEKSSEDATGVATFGSIFVEKTLGSRFLIGVDYVPSALSSATAENDRFDKTATETPAAVKNSVKVDFDNLTTYYVAFNVTENMYVKVGAVTVDIITNEKLGTGSTYKNTDMSGETYGLGYNASFDNGMFARFEGTYTDFGSASVTSSTNTDNKISMKNLEGAMGKISIGKSF